MSNDTERYYTERVLALCKRLGIETDSERFPRIVLDRALNAILDRLDSIEARLGDTEGLA